MRLLHVLDTKKAKTVKYISPGSGMELRQTYRCLEVLKAEKILQKFDTSPARYRLKPIGTRFRKSMRSE